MHLRGSFVLLAIVCSALLFPNSPFGVSASGGSIGEHTTGSTQHIIEPVNVMQNMPPAVGVPMSSNEEAARKERRAARKAKAEARKLRAEKTAHKLEVKEYRKVLKKAQLNADERNSKVSNPGAHTTGSVRHNRIADRAIPSIPPLAKVPLPREDAAALKAKEDKVKQEKEQLYGGMRHLQRPLIDNLSVERLIMKNPLVKDALQMLDTLGLPKEPSQETLKQLRFLFLMLSDDLNLYNPELGKCIHIPDDSHTLSRLKTLAKYCVLTMATAEAMVTLPPFHELFCFSDYQMFPMMWFLREFIDMESTAKEYTAIKQAFKDNENRSDEIGPLAFDPARRFSLIKVSEDVEKTGRKITRKTIIYSPEEWVKRKSPVRSSPVAQSSYPLTRKKWTINSLSELVELRPDLNLQMLNYPWNAASDLGSTARKLAAFFFTRIGQSLLPTVKLGSKFQFGDLLTAVSNYHYDRTPKGSETSDRTMKKIWDWILRHQPKRVPRSKLNPK